MSHFYGIVSGGMAKTDATRRGDRNSGLITTAASWQGAVVVTLYTKGTVDCARIEFTPWRGRGNKRTLYDGPIGEET